LGECPGRDLGAAATRLAARFGLVRTMVFTHLPSNILLILVPLMPSLPLATLVLLARFSISQMTCRPAVVHHGRRRSGGTLGGAASRAWRERWRRARAVFAGFLYARPALMSRAIFHRWGV